MADGAEGRVRAGDLGLGVPAGRTVETQTLEEAERVFIEKALARHGGDVRQAADQLGMSRSALYRRLQQYGLKN
jgi:DNA-binding NtrC family response regulator